MKDRVKKQPKRKPKKPARPPKTLAAQAVEK